MKANVSVLVPTFNRAHYLGQALDSVLSQSPTPSQVLVVDDGSIDDTRALVNRYSDRVQYLWKRNGGRSSALNAGLPLLTGDWVWLFDDDDVATPDSLALRLEALKSRPGVDFVYSSHFVGRNAPDGSIQCERLYEIPVLSGEAIFLELTRACFFNLQGTLIGRHCFAIAGAFDESFSRGGDYDWMLRLSRSTFGIGIDDPTYIFRQHSGVRGPTHALHSETDREQIWLLAEQRVGLWLRESLPLDAFLTGGERSSLKAALAARLALLRRTASMWSKGMIVEGVADLLEGVRRYPEATLSDEEALLCRVGVIHESCQLGLLSTGSALIEAAQILSVSVAGRHALRSLCRGLLWIATKGRPNRLSPSQALALATRLALLTLPRLGAVRP